MAWLILGGLIALFGGIVITWRRISGKGFCIFCAIAKHEAPAKILYEVLK
jgi:hypothetical protein